ncbi:hypothetical protein [Flavobacterium aquicola]|uniref:Uncharacterized protein n=1 Tax=Flavobacterium aquicola TaxID=1682742 RepID=A0A3E0EFR2_9FLAO|nr:hypothetical protein [Flavobacterium aquicola]REG96490.1 hypothetical protein C8P67_109139 [Flavobacterium aquicola]
MKKIKFIAVVLFTAIFASCSSGDDTNENTETPTATGSFDFVYNNETKKVNSWEAKKMDDYLQVKGLTSDGIVVNFVFNAYGNLYGATTFGASSHETSEIFTSNTFTFTLEELNTANKTVKVKFSGKMYIDGYDSESDFIIVSGSFNVPYTNATPDIPGLGTFAKFNGNDWHGMAFDSSTTWSTQITTLNVQNDGEYSLGIVFPKGDLKTGTFSFTGNDFSNGISLEKFDVETGEYVDYNVAGTITYTTVAGNYVEGTFSLTATHPDDDSQIVITEGKFKEMTK